MVVKKWWYCKEEFKFSKTIQKINSRSILVKKTLTLDELLKRYKAKYTKEEGRFPSGLIRVKKVDAKKS